MTKGDKCNGVAVQFVATKLLPLQKQTRVTPRSVRSVKTERLATLKNGEKLQQISSHSECKSPFSHCFMIKKTVHLPLMHYQTKFRLTQTDSAPEWYTVLNSIQPIEYTHQEQKKISNLKIKRSKSPRWRNNANPWS